ncbi:hypothetical protein DRW03_14605 [Corallococcus sp. H22C18031201]|nr:hypothetical protein DRW03_14605 [Corallococcus sp. H22C18031201]
MIPQSLRSFIPPRAHPWAARLVLLVACASVVATSAPSSPDIFSPPRTGTPVQLTSQEPSVTRNVVVQVSSKENLFGRVEGALQVRATARWTPTNPSQSARPWLRVVLEQPGSSPPLLGSAVTLGGPGETVTLSERAFVSSPPDCRSNEAAPCAFPMTVRFELERGVAEGTVDIEWDMLANVHVDGHPAMPEDFAVGVFEP